MDEKIEKKDLSKMDFNDLMLKLIKVGVLKEDITKYDLDTLIVTDELTKD